MTSSKSSHRRGGNNVYTHRRRGNGAYFKHKTSHSRGALLLLRESPFEKEEALVQPQLLSFLQKDASFLCPWGSGSEGLQNEASSSSKKTTKQYMHFQPGSLFAVEVFDSKAA